VKSYNLKFSEFFTRGICSSLLTMLNIGMLISIGIWGISVWLGFGTGMFWPLLIGFVVWAILLFHPKTGIWDQYIFFVKANHGVVVGNRFKKEIAGTTEAQIDDTQEITSMRECGPGPHGKGWLSEYFVDYFDTRKKLLIGGTTTVYDKNNIPWLIKWQGYLTPLYGSLIHLARKGDGVAQEFFQGFFDAAIAKEIRGKDGYEQLKNYNEFGAWFENLLEGPKKTHPLEMEYGMFTNRPQILEMTTTAEMQQAAEQVAKSKKNKDAADEYVKMGMTPKEALDRVLAQENNAELIVIDAPKGMTTFVGAKGKGGK
jgi:hypothetical protein